MATDDVVENDCFQPLFEGLSCGNDGRVGRRTSRRKYDRLSCEESRIFVSNPNISNGIPVDSKMLIDEVGNAGVGTPLFLQRLELGHGGISKRVWRLGVKHKVSPW